MCLDGPVSTLLNLLVDVDAVALVGDDLEKKAFFGGVAVLKSRDENWK